MGDLQKIVSALNNLLTESEEILGKKQSNLKTALQQLQARSDKLAEQNGAYRVALITMSRTLLQYEEYLNAVHPMWGAVDAARKLLAMGKATQASKMLEKAKSQWEKEVFTFDLEDFPETTQHAFDRLAQQIGQLLADCFSAIDSDDPKAQGLLRQLHGKTDNLFDVYDDSLDELLENLKAS